MKISVACDLSSSYSAIKKAGFDGVDFSFETHDKKEYILSDGYTDEIKSAYTALMSEGLEVCQAHLTYYPGHIPPIGDGTYAAFEEYMLPMLQKEIELTSIMGCHTAVIHLYFEKDREQSRAGNISLINKLMPTLNKYGVVLSLENIYGPEYSDAHLSTAEDLTYYVDYFGNEHIGVCLDTGHAIIRGQSPVEMLLEIGDKLTAVHLHTTVPQIDLHSIPYCTSYGECIDWYKLFDILSGIGYSGAFNLEVRPPENVSDVAISAYYRLAYEIAKDIVDKTKQNSLAERN